MYIRNGVPTYNLVSVVRMKHSFIVNSTGFQSPGASAASKIENRHSSIFLNEKTFHSVCEWALVLIPDHCRSIYCTYAIIHFYLFTIIVRASCRYKYY